MKDDELDRLVKRLREDVFYGEERLHKLSKHNPLHQQAADAIDALRSPPADVGDKSSCRRCGKKMQRGLAIEPTFVGGIKDFASDTAPVTLSAGGPGRLVDCWKCPGCGHSFALAETTKGDE